MDMVKLNENIELFCALFILGGISVIIASTKLEKIIFLPAWLSGWAITLLIMAPLNMNWGNLTCSNRNINVNRRMVCRCIKVSKLTNYDDKKVIQ